MITSGHPVEKLTILSQDTVTGGGTLADSRLQGLQQVVKLSPICQVVGPLQCWMGSQAQLGCDFSNWRYQGGVWTRSREGQETVIILDNRGFPGREVPFRLILQCKDSWHRQPGRLLLSLAQCFPVLGGPSEMWEGGFGCFPETSPSSQGTRLASYQWIRCWQQGSA